MKCRKCNREIPDDAIYCCYCGIKQSRESSIAMRRPPGAGCVKKLVGNRNKPWAALITKDKKQIYVGFFETKTEAESALVKFTSKKERKV